MNLFRNRSIQAVSAGLILSLVALLASCDIGSVDSTSAVISDNAGNIYNYSGLYMNPNNSSDNAVRPLVYPEGRQSGTTLTSLRLMQYGSVLEGYDNAGLAWSGKISSQNGGVASFTLRGQTTVGSNVEIAGTLTTDSGPTPNPDPGTNTTANMALNTAAKASAAEATMNAAWIEPAFSGTILAQATVAPVVPTGPLVIRPSSASLNTNSPTATFTVTGGSGTYTWSVGNSSLGSVSPTSGDATVYTSTHAEGINTVTVTDSNDNTAFVTVEYSQASPGNLSISPSSVNLNKDNYVAQFIASGGTGTYTWYVSTPTLGTLSPDSGSAVRYTSTRVPGANTITVTDSSGATRSARAVYSGTVDLTVSPSAAMLTSNSYYQVFTASGGTPPYTWNVAPNTLGTWEELSDDKIGYTSLKLAGTAFITVTDTDGISAVATARYQ